MPSQTIETARKEDSRTLYSTRCSPPQAQTWRVALRLSCFIAIKAALLLYFLELTAFCFSVREVIRKVSDRYVGQGALRHRRLIRLAKAALWMQSEQRIHKAAVEIVVRK